MNEGLSLEMDEMTDIAANRTAVLFGGSGFVGLHLTRHLIDERKYDRVILADIKPPQDHPAYRLMASLLESGKCSYVKCDVREPITSPDLLLACPALIVNLAAIHREPGHKLHEYWETNIPGAENICDYAEAIDCNNMIFTSSISPYGPTESQKDEASIPLPETPYGSSKLVAEHIHKIWQAKKSMVRRLTILRPGVIFGPGEGGNVSRLIRFISRHGLFVYAGNRLTRKAGIYIKELCRALTWVHFDADIQSTEPQIVNMSFNPSATMQDFVEGIGMIGQRKVTTLEIPASLLMILGGVIHRVGSLFKVQTSFDPVRLRKTVRSNNIVPTRLKQLGYTYKYNLKDALLDWKLEMPEEWV